jgi:hypothetical protein
MSRGRAATPKLVNSSLAANRAFIAYASLGGGLLDADIMSVSQPKHGWTVVPQTWPGHLANAHGACGNAILYDLSTVRKDELFGYTVWTLSAPADPSENKTTVQGSYWLEAIAASQSLYDHVQAANLNRLVKFEEITVPSRSIFYEQVRGMADLQAGWDSYDAPAPSPIARTLAVRVLDELVDSELTPSKVLPSAEGGVTIAFSATDSRRYADIECFNTGEVLAVTSDRQSEPTVWPVGTESSVKDTIERIAAFLSQHETTPPASERSSRSSGPERSNDSALSPLSPNTP